jgi:hypothetical protein
VGQAIRGQHHARGAHGFEIFAPLSNKGYAGGGDAWGIFDDPAYRFYQWDQQRYWYLYALFGRLGYSGAADPDAWRREWALRFGERAAVPIEEALREASHFLPLITACRLPNASLYRF